MTKTLYYKTLKGLIGKTYFKQFTLNDYFSKTIYHKDKGHIKIRLSKDLNKEIRYLFLSFLGLPYFNYNKTYSIFDRLIISSRLKVDYIAGQDYPSEIRTLKRILK